MYRYDTLNKKHIIKKYKNNLEYDIFDKIKTNHK